MTNSNFLRSNIQRRLQQVQFWQFQSHTPEIRLTSFSVVERLEVGIVNFLDYQNVVYINQQTIILVTSLLIKIHDHWSTTIEFHAKCLISLPKLSQFVHLQASCTLVLSYTAKRNKEILGQLVFPGQMLHKLKEPLKCFLNKIDTSLSELPLIQIP